MRKFRFRFESILNQRKRREEETLRALASAQNTFQQARAFKTSLQKSLENGLIRREKLGGEPTGIQAFQVEQHFINGTKQRIIQAEQAITRATRGVEKALRTYMHARRQTRMFEELREKDYAEYRKQKAKEEEKFLNDLTVMRHGRMSTLAALDDLPAEESA